MVAKLLAVKTSERVRNIQFNLNNSVENFECFGGNNRVESKKESIGIDYCIILPDGKSFHVITPWGLRYSRMLSSVSALKIGFLMIPFDEFKLLCSVTSTGTPKKEVCFFKFSV